MKRRLRVRIVAVGVLFVLGAAMLEILSRLIFPCHRRDDCFWPKAMHQLLNSGVAFDSSQSTYNEVFGYQLSPNAEKLFESPEYRHVVRTNSLGFRTKELAPKEAREQRFLLLGDSFFFGVGLDESEMLENHLERMGEREDRDITAYTFAMTGYNTVQEYLVAREFIDVVSPDDTLLGFFVGNDVIPNAVAFVDDDGNYAHSEEKLSLLEGEVRAAFPPILRDSVVFRILAQRAYVPRIRYEFASREHVLADTYRWLLELRELAARHDSRFWVVIIYPRDSVRGGLVESWSNSTRVGELVRRFCQRERIDVIDMIDYMKGTSDLARYYYRQDGHLTPAGSERMADAVYEAVFN